MHRQLLTLSAIFLTIGISLAAPVSNSPHLRVKYQLKMSTVDCCQRCLSCEHQNQAPVLPLLICYSQLKREPAPVSHNDEQLSRTRCTELPGLGETVFYLSSFNGLMLSFQKVPCEPLEVIGKPV